MTTLPFAVYDLVRRTAIDYAPELDQEQEITAGMVGVVTSISHAGPMFTVLFSDTQDGIYMTDELEKVGYRVYQWNPFSYEDVML